MRIKGSTLGWSLAWGLALVVAAFGPFWVGSATIGVLGEYKFVSVGVAGAIKFLLQPFFGVKATLLAVVIVTGLALAAFALIVWRARWTYPSEAANLAWLCYRVLAIFAIFAVPWFHPWYLTWVVALGALLPAVSMARQLAVFSAGGLMLYLAQFYASRYWWGLPPSLAEILWSLALLTVGLGAAVLAVWIYAFRQTLTWTGLAGAPYPASVEEMVQDNKRTMKEADKEVAD